MAAFLRGTSGLEEVAPESCPPDAVALVALNRGDNAATVDLALTPDGVRDVPAWPATSHALDALTGAAHPIRDRLLRITLPPFGASVIVPVS